MVFAVRNLSVLAYANGFILWLYKAGKEKLDTVRNPISSPTPPTCWRWAI